jgi:hypothetical protein
VRHLRELRAELQLATCWPFKTHLTHGTNVQPLTQQLHCSGVTSQQPSSAYSYLSLVRGSPQQRETGRATSAAAPACLDRSPSHHAPCRSS